MVPGQRACLQTKVRFIMDVKMCDVFLYLIIALHTTDTKYWSHNDTSDYVEKFRPMFHFMSQEYGHRNRNHRKLQE